MPNRREKERNRTLRKHDSIGIRMRRCINYEHMRFYRSVCFSLSTELAVISWVDQIRREKKIKFLGSVISDLFQQSLFTTIDHCSFYIEYSTRIVQRLFVQSVCLKFINKIGRLQNGKQKIFIVGCYSGVCKCMHR